MKNNKTVIGIDLGATNIRGAILEGKVLGEILSEQLDHNASFEELLEQFYRFMDQLMHSDVHGIGMGVPGIVDKGMVYDLLNIPAWKEVPLKKMLEERYRVPVTIENDANCFALGEFNFGKGRGRGSMAGLTIGTGLGSGLIIEGKLYSGSTGVAGEFGMVPYLDKNYDYYASGSFFENVYGINGSMVFDSVNRGEAEAFRMYAELGVHIGNAIQTILYSTDISCIILGGSVKDAYRYFSGSMWEQVQTFGFKRSINKLEIEVSDLQNGGVLGAASLIG